ncbi:MAG: flagellar biosynthesis protein FlhF [Clostridiales bacterium]|jgi:flagellar biosynthesis protein FlhF|nr:flagellar biosynthesis protein FlhF [Clostridiales bacterium]
MFVKRYIANDMPEAMEKIRKELGSDAVILSHRSMRKKGVSGLLKKKLVEVTVAYEQPIAGNAPAKTIPAIQKNVAIPIAGSQSTKEAALNIRAAQVAQDIRRALDAQEAQPGAVNAGGGPDDNARPVAHQTDPNASQRAAMQSAVAASGATKPIEQYKSVTQYQQAAARARYGAPAAVQEPTPQILKQPEWTHIDPPAPGKDWPETVEAIPGREPGITEEDDVIDADPAKFEAVHIVPKPEALPTESPRATPGTPLATADMVEAEALNAAAPPAKAQAGRTWPEQEQPEQEQLEQERPEQEQPAQARDDPPSDAKLDELNARIAQLRGVVQSLTTKIITENKEGILEFSPAVMKIYNTLIENDVQEDLSRSISWRISRESEANSCDGITQIALAQLLRILGEPEKLRITRNRRNVVMLVGPTGVGKTTTLVKLAGLFAINHGLRVGFINTDTYRVAAQEQLKIYADIMDIPCCTVYTPDEIPLALHQLHDCELVLVDTAGRSMNTQESQDETRAFIQESGAQKILLHVSASMSARSCQKMINNYAFIDDYSLVATKLDEVNVLGNLLNISIYAKKPISFITVGQKVPQDIEIPDMRQIAARLLESVGV